MTPAAEWQRAAVPFVYLTNPTGAYLEGALEPDRHARVDRVAWRADQQLVIEVDTYGLRGGLIVDARGGTTGMLSGILDPSGTRTARVRDGRAELLDLQGRVLAAIGALGANAGSYGGASFAWSPSGARLAIGAYRAVFVVSFDPLRVARHDASDRVVGNVDFIDERRLAVLTMGTSTVLDVDSGARLCEARLPGAAFSPGGGVLATRDGEELLFGGPRLHRASSSDPGRLTAIDWSEPGFARPLGFSESGAHLLIGTPQSLCVVDWPECRTIARLPTGPRALECAAFSRDGTRLVGAGGGIVHFWSRGGETPRRAESPLFPVRSIPVLRASGELHVPSSLQELERRVIRAAYFERLGQEASWSASVRRLARLEDWPGVESEEGASLAVQQQSWWDAAETARVALELDGAAAERLARMAETAASARLASAAPDDEVCVAQLGFTIRTLALLCMLGWPVPDDLGELFLIYEAGHWPCGYATSTGRESPTKLMVL